MAARTESWLSAQECTKYKAGVRHQRSAVEEASIVSEWIVVGYDETTGQWGREYNAVRRGRRMDRGTVDQRRLQPSNRAKNKHTAPMMYGGYEPLGRCARQVKCRFGVGLESQGFAIVHACD